MVNLVKSLSKEGCQGRVKVEERSGAFSWVLVSFAVSDFPMIPTTLDWPDDIGIKRAVRVAIWVTLDMVAQL